MDVDKSTFFYHLPTILKRISNAHFIAFDLELSGIPEFSKKHSSGRASLQERYTDIKEAAEKYQILQIGLTIVEEDQERNRYLIRPFNFNLSPLIDDERYVNVERDFTYSSSAVNFLRGQSYDMSSPFSKGVPYLTRQETKHAWARAEVRFDRNSIPDIQITESDTHAIDFVTKLKEEISDWEKSTKKKKPEYIEVTGDGVSGNKKDRVLTRYEKRLVHQTVRSHFPHLETFSTPNAVKVKRKNGEILDPEEEPWRRRTAASVCLQTGFRWVAEAIAAGNLDGLDPVHCGRRISGEPETPNRASFRKRIRDLAQACTNTPKVLVGHNCFLDTVYLFKLFYGDLPEKVEDFQAAVHATFPLILDTKYIVTSGANGNRFRGSQLWEVDQAFEKQEDPHVYEIDDHPQYAEDQKSFHEAGFDSFITAKVFLRLVAKLNLQTTSTGEVVPNSDIPQSQRTDTSRRSCEKSDYKQDRKEVSDAGNSKLLFPDSDRGDATNKYASKNMFDCLSDSDMEAASNMVENPASTSNTVRPETVKSLRDGVETLTVDDVEAEEPSPPTIQHSSYLMPKWDMDFWQQYKNKLRVFGTTEEVCELGPVTQRPTEKPKETCEAVEASSLLQRVWQLFS